MNHLILLFFLIETSLSSLNGENSEFHSQNTRSTVFWSGIDVFYGDRQILEVPGGALRPGRLLGILGPSGSGKSTFLNAIAGRLHSSSGIGLGLGLGSSNAFEVKSDVAAVRVEGEEGVSQPIRLQPHNVAFVSQEDSFFPMLSVYETLKLTAQLKSLQSKSKSHASLCESNDNMNIKENNNNLNDEIISLIRSLGLSNVQHNRIGDKDNRGISG